MIQLWDVRHQEPLGALPIGLSVLDVAFSPDGTTLVASTLDGIQRWGVNVGSWKRRACRIANRNLTPQEWTRYLIGIPYHRTCPAVP
jgi:WD40 repeat protein